VKSVSGFWLVSIVFVIPILLLSRAPAKAEYRLPEAGRPVQTARSDPGSGGGLTSPALIGYLLTDTARLEGPPDPTTTRQAAQTRAAKANSGLAPGLIMTNATAFSSALAIASDPTLITFSDFITQPNPASSAVVDTSLTFFPTQGNDYAALSTGSTSSIPMTGTFASADLGGGPVRGTNDRDVTIWRIGMNVPAGVYCLGLDFQFLSEEFPGYVGSVFNDAFIGELDQSTWTTVQTSTISAPDNFIFDGAGNLITVNSVVGLSAGNGAGTAFDGGTEDGGATGLLTARTVITPGLHTLYLSILDQRDNIFDSAVLIDNLVLFNTADCPTGVVEKPKIFLPLIFKDVLFAPDLVVDSLTADANSVTVTIKNTGSAPVLDSFWVDVYLDPQPAPTKVNQHWWELAGQGLVWGVTQPIAVGESLTLTIGDPYFSTFHSHFTSPLAAGTPIWAQVDSVNLNTNYGGVLELHEITGGPYNNINSALSTAKTNPTKTPLAAPGAPPAADQKLPPR
jgi:hypothetical protein